MDGSRFDSLTRTLCIAGSRRRALAGLLVGGLSVFGSRAEGAVAKKKKPCPPCKKRKKGRCKGKKPDGAACPGGTCQGGVCLPPCTGQPDYMPCNGNGRCRNEACIACQSEGVTCTSYESCCSLACDFAVGGGTCGPCRGRSCSVKQPCCGGLACIDEFCGGCHDRGGFCTDPSQCCFSDCTNGLCFSAKGGRCSRDADCEACNFGNTCPNGCVNGACAD